MISFIYFDVGGVVIKDFSATNKWSELEKDLGITKERQKEFLAFWDKYEPEVCVGRDIETLLPLIKKQFGVDIPSNYSLLSAFVDRFERNETIWPVIRKARQKYKIGLLTNMYTNMLNAIYDKGLMPKVEWEIIIDSSIEQTLKPEKKIFDISEQRAGVAGENILFVENSKRHVDMAKSLEWQTFYYDSADVDKSSTYLDRIISRE